MTGAEIEGVQVATGHWIGGERVASAATFEDVSPIDETVLAEVSRGTAATVLKHLREQPTPLHLITTTSQAGHPEDDPTIEEQAQP